MLDAHAWSTCEGPHGGSLLAAALCGARSVRCEQLHREVTVKEAQVLCLCWYDTEERRRNAGMAPPQHPGAGGTRVYQDAVQG